MTPGRRLHQLYHYRGLPRSYVTSSVASWRRRELFDDLATFCLFLGHSRSGSSLVGSLLSAHPSMVIAHELDVLRYVQLGFGRRQLFQLILERDAWFSQTDRATKSGYHYEVPGLSQGQVGGLRVIGDKKAGNTANRLARHPELLPRLRTVVRLPLRLVYVVRNPFDTVTTMSRKSGHGLQHAIDRFVAQCEVVERVRAAAPDDLVAVRFEALVVEPQTSLMTLCGFLGVDAPKDYLDGCAAIVRPQAPRRRDEVRWDGGLVEDLEGHIRRFPLLAGYSFED